jgi:hypothetical protein
MFYRTVLLALTVAIGLAGSAAAQQQGPGTAGAQPPAVTAPVANPPAQPFVVNPTIDDEGGFIDPFADPYGASPAVPAGAKQQAGGGYPGVAGPGADHEDGGGAPEDEEPVPQNPVRKVYEDGKIVVLVGSERHFGYRIGDVAPVTILVLADDSVTLNFDAIKKGVLGFDGSDFELVDPANIRIIRKESGKTLWRMDLAVRSFVPRKGIVFTADFQYALGMGPDGKTPDWKVLTTPGFVVSTSNTADNGTDLLEGDLSERPYKISWFTYPLLLAGLSLVLLWPSLLLLAWYRRVRPPRVVPPNEQAWRVFNRVFKEAKASGWTCKHYKQLAAALRTYLGVEPATLEEVVERLKDHPDLPTIKSALRKCEAVLYAKKPLSDAENDELVSELEKLVPR